MSSFQIVLIRGIGGASHRLITMKELERAVVEAGVGDVRSVLATGNFVVRSARPSDLVADCFDREMRKRGLQRPLVMRTPSQLQAVIDAGIEHPAVLVRPSRVLVSFFQKPASASTVADINARAPVEEPIMLGGELVLDFVQPISESRLSLEFIERCAGSIGTTRNWNTVLKILGVAVEMGWTSSHRRA
jgi:uncharacterized protein (DUF1697 family)